MHIRPNIPSWNFTTLANFVVAFRFLNSRDYIAELTNQISNDLNSVNHIYFFSSGTAALIEAIQHLGLSKQRIAVPAYVCPDIIVAIRSADAVPFLVDVAPLSLSFDLNILGDLKRKKIIDGIIAPNTYGVDQPLNEIKALGIPVIEDAAYQSGLVDPQTSIHYGLRTHAGIWSFNFKALTSVSGGILFTNEPLERSKLIPNRAIDRHDLYLLINRMVRAFLGSHIPKFLGGATPPSTHTPSKSLDLPITNLPHSRVPTQLAAAIALDQWKNKSEIFEKIRSNNARLKQLGHCLSTLEVIKNHTHSTRVLPFVQSSNTSQQNNAVRTFLYRNKIQTKDPYPIYCDNRSKYPNAEHLASRLILVPCGSALKPNEIDHISSVLKMLDTSLA